MKSDFRRIRVLFIQQEYSNWWEAYQWAYYWHLGIEEGLRANNVELFTLTTHWLNRAEEFCARKKYDQVWINDIVHLDVDERWMEWVSTLSPVRLGFTVESLKYSPEEYGAFPELKSRESGIKARFKYLTHVVALDERDADDINMGGRIPAIWSPPAVPRRYFFRRNMFNPDGPAAFCGRIYGERSKWLENPVLNPMFVHPSHPDNGMLYTHLFNRLPIVVNIFNKMLVPKEMTLLLYLYSLRQIRRKSFLRYLRSLHNYCATVNLPSLFKGYGGRVVEGMIAGCPVISWRVPDRPRTEGLFIDNVEILFFDKDTPDYLANQIKRIKTERGLAYRLIENAKKKMLKFHTMEMRIQQILSWIETGKVPKYV